MAEDFPIKVCGITRLEDAQLAMKLGAFAIGFIFYPKSPRYIAPAKVRLIIEDLRKTSTILTVGVFVDESAEEVRRFQADSGVDIVQLHGNESPELLLALKDLRIWKAFRLKSVAQLQTLDLYEPLVEAFLFDAAVTGEYGGTGHRVEADLLARLPRQKPIIIAGGLGPDNWRDVALTYRPFAIDLSSGVESSPGIKDPQKLKKLFSGKG